MHRNDVCCTGTGANYHCRCGDRQVVAERHGKLVNHRPAKQPPHASTKTHRSTALQLARFYTGHLAPTAGPHPVGSVWLTSCALVAVAAQAAGTRDPEMQPEVEVSRGHNCVVPLQSSESSTTTSETYCGMVALLPVQAWPPAAMCWYPQCTKKPANSSLLLYVAHRDRR
jgi:hypothetical protein